MKKGHDLKVEFPHLSIIHQKVPGKELKNHTHNEHEFFIPLQGEIKVKSENLSLNCGPGKLLYIPPHIEHSFSSSSSGQGERIIFLISDKLWRKSSQELFLPSFIPLNSLVKELVFYLLLNPQSPFSKTFIKALVESLIEHLSIHKNLHLRLYDYGIKNFR